MKEIREYRKDGRHRDVAFHADIWLDGHGKAIVKGLQIDGDPANYLPGSAEGLEKAWALCVAYAAERIDARLAKRS